MDNDYCIRKTIKDGLRGDVNNDFYEVESKIYKFVFSILNIEKTF